MSEDRPFKDNKIFTEAAAIEARDRLRTKLAELTADRHDQSAPIPLGSSPTIADEVGDDMEIEDLLPFDLAEKVFVEQIIAEVRKRMASAEPETLRKVAAFLFALERLPYPTPDVSLDLAITQRVNEDLSYVSIDLDGESLRLSTGGYLYSPDVGGDSYSETTVELQVGGFRLGSTEDFSDWLDAFISAPGILEVAGDTDADLTERGEQDGWVRIANYLGEDSDGR